MPTSLPSPLPPGLAARAHRAVEPLHSFMYFVPEAEQELTAVGLRPGRMPYFASRSAPMGAVTAAVTAATFYNFNPAVVAKYLPRAWSLASVADVLAARLRIVDRAYRRVFGSDVASAPEIAELLALLRPAVTDLPVEARPLFAGHAALPWPDDPHLALWHAVTLEREYRGDGHSVVLQHHGLSGLAALVTKTATGRDFPVAAAKATRGWSDEQWAAEEARLAGRGLLTADGRLTPDGEALRAALETDTDRLEDDLWTRLDPATLDRVVELGKALSRALVDSGAFAILGAR